MVLMRTRRPALQLLFLREMQLREIYKQHTMIDR